MLQEHVADESVDLVYLDPPFNSNATYHVLFRERPGGYQPQQRVRRPQGRLAMVGEIGGGDAPVK